MKGRKTKYTPERIQKICDLIQEDTYTIPEICKQVGISEKTFHTWKNDKADFKKVIADSNQKIIDNRTKNINHKIKNNGSGYVYIIKVEGFNYYKIGISKHKPNNRISNLQSGCPFELRYIDIFYCENHRELENSMHVKLSKKRVRGEWFELSEKELNKTIESIKKQIATQLQLF